MEKLDRVATIVVLFVGIYSFFVDKTDWSYQSIWIAYLFQAYVFVFFLDILWTFLNPPQHVVDEFNKLYKLERRVKKEGVDIERRIVPHNYHKERR